MTTTQTTNPTASAPSRRLTIALLVIATAQLMLVLDDSVANIALPTIGRDLGMSATGLPWVISAYVLVFGALLLLGGRLGDLLGRRRAFRAGVAVFTIASLAGGIAPDGAGLVAARALQGLGAALAAPNALALIRSTFPEGEARNKAIGAYGAMSGLGIVGGLLLGGLLTGTVGWRAVFLINVPIGLAVLAGTRTLVEGERHQGRVDMPGAVTVTAGTASLAYAFTRAGEHGWDDAVTLTAFAAAAVLLTAFLLLQRRGTDSLLPLHVLADRGRAASYAIMLVTGIGLLGTFYVITLWMQQVAGYGPIRTGLAWLPFALGIVFGTVSQLQPDRPHRTAAGRRRRPGAGGHRRRVVLPARQRLRLRRGTAAGHLHARPRSRTGLPAADPGDRAGRRGAGRGRRRRAAERLAAARRRDRRGAADRRLGHRR